MTQPQAIDFFKRLFEFSEGNIEIRALKDGKAHPAFFHLEDLAGIREHCQNYAKWDLYFGVCTRNGGGTREHIVSIPALWSDIDYKMTPLDEFAELYAKFPFKASAIILSGGGCHPYWFLKEALTKADIPKVEEANRRIAQALKGDFSAVDAARILRVPRTLNYKYIPPREVRVSQLNDFAYELDDFLDILPEVEKGPHAKTGDRNPQGWQDELLKGVKASYRHQTALRLAGRWAQKGLSDAEIVNGILAWNRENHPPKETLADPQSDEIKKILDYVRGKNPEEKDPLRFPEHVMSGFCSDLARIHSEHLEPPAHFFFMAGLTCLGSILAGRLTSASEISPPPRLYTVLLGESADDRKSTAISKTVGFFRNTIDGFSTLLGAGSAEGIQRKLKKSHNLLLVLDELKGFVGKCKIENSVLLPCVTTLFEETSYESWTKKTEVSIDNAHLSLLAASTTATFEKIWTPAFIDIGFVNRLFLVPGSGERRFAFPSKIPDKIIRDLEYKLRNVLRYASDKREIDLTQDAKALFESWYLSLERSVHTKRLDTYALRLMPLLAANNLKDVIDAETVSRVIELCDWQLAVRRELDPIDADNKTAAMEEKIRRAINKKPHTDRELKQATNAHRDGLWIYEAAKRNLLRSYEMKWNRKEKIYEKV